MVKKEKKIEAMKYEQEVWIYINRERTVRKEIKHEE